MKFISPVILITLFYPLKSQIISENKDSLNKSFYVEAGSYGTKRMSEPPEYSINLNDLSTTKNTNIQWLDFGFESRTRGEWRKNDLRRDELTSNDIPVLLRQKVYLGIKNIMDPLRIVFEAEDARKLNSQYPEDTKDDNHHEIIQSYAQLYFKNVLKPDSNGNPRPIGISYGRMAFEVLDRRLLASNQWRNTTNNFSGLKGFIGDDDSKWAIDFFALKPIIRNVDEFDKADHDQFFTGIIGHWREWSKLVTIEPYYMGLKQNSTESNKFQTKYVHGIGMRLYGWSKNHIWNYDITGMYEFGKSNEESMEAYSYTTEIGYTFNNSSNKPRISAFFGYASGDLNPNDGKNNRFERYFGFSRPWSSDDYIVMENILSTKIKMEMSGKLFNLKYKLDGGYSLYWLASATDRMNNLFNGSNNRDLSGKSGSFIGHGVDVRFRTSLTTYADLNLGYSHFFNGNFVQNMQLENFNDISSSTDFLYLEITINFLNYFKN